MKKTFKTLVALTLSLALIVSGSVFSFAQEVKTQFDPSKYTYNVMVDGNYVEFTDAAPANINGRVMVPFRAILEKLGATVSWDQKTKSATAKLGDTSINFVVGKSEINVTKDGKTSVKKMDVAPYIDKSNNRTYVSTRFVAESLGYDVGWDSLNKTAVIINYDKLFAGADKEFTVFDNYLKSAATEKGVTYESAMDMSLNMTVSKLIMNLLVGSATFTKDMDLSVKMNGTVLSKDMESSADATLKLNLSDLIKAVPAGTASVDELLALAKLSEMKVTAYMDAEKGELYFTTNVNSVFDSTYTDKTWFKINLYEAYATTGVDLETLVSMSGSSNSVTDMSTVLDSMAAGTENSMTIYTYDEMAASYELLKGMFGNSSFKESKSGATTTYTSEFDLSGLEGTEGFDKYGGKMVLTEKNGTYGFVMNFVMESKELGTFAFDVSQTTAKTNKTIQKVPADAVIVSLD